MKLLPFRPPGGAAGRGAANLSPEEAAAARLKRLTIAILAIGFGSAVVIFIAATAPADNPLGYEPLQTKKYLHDLELYGGKANVLATEFREWFAGLWHGTNLAYTVAVATLLLVWIVRFFLTPLPEEPALEEDGAPPTQRRNPSGPVRIPDGGAGEKDRDRPA